MSNPSNLYAEKILSEHPLVMWSLDDTSDYVSIISESFRNINGWTISNGTKSSSSISSPFPNSYTTQINGANSAGTTGLTSASTFSSDSDGFTVSFYIKTSTDVDIQVGYTGTTQTQTIKGASYPQGTWIPVSFTFNTQATNKNLIINLIYLGSNPTYYINGLTIGKNSEPFNGESLGQSLISISSDIATTQTSGIESKSYGTAEHSAYYIGNNNNLFAKNNGMSLSYGSSNSMTIYPHSTNNQPSFIFPAMGMLNECGRYKELTLEMLIRINSSNSIPKRIIGPLSSTDGIYITKESISLKINDYIKSAYLPEQFRPMIMQFQIGENYAVLSIDGEEIINIQTSTSELTLPDEFDNSDKNQDWFGIFAYSDIPFIEIDSIAIYPYKCSTILAKRRMVYAQGVDIPLEINSKYGGSSALIDFEYINYVNSYNYPSFQTKWEQASILDNLDVVSGKTISTVKYESPQIFTSSYNSDLLLKDIYETNLASGEANIFINLKPSSVVSGSGRSWSSSFGYIYTKSYNVSEHLSNCIFGIFKSLESSGTKQILFKILNNFNGDYVEASIVNTTVSYKFKYNGVETVLSTSSITQNNIFAIGLDIKYLTSINQDISLFFANKDLLELYVGGDNLSSNTFSGNIYRVGLCSTTNFSYFSNLFSSGFITTPASYSSFLSKNASYTILPINNYSKIILDIASNAYWQDYVPLQKLSKTVYDNSNNQIDDLDFIQLDFDYPEPKVFSSNNFDTTSSIVKTYISFQELSSGINKKSSDFATTVSANKNRVIDASTFSATTKYEFVSGMIVYPPKDVDFSALVLVVHIEINTDSVNLKPIQIRHLQIAAQTLDYLDKNYIGTRHSVNLYPYKIINGEYDYKAKNPYLVYKESTPYLYLTKYTGVRICGDYDSETNRGMYIELGSSSTETQINSIQMSLLPDIKEFSTTGIKIFSIESKDSVLNFYVKALNTAKTKGIIYTDSSDNIPIYYLNGKMVASPVIELGQWNILGVSLINPVNMSYTIGKLSLKSNILIDNISYYGINSIEIAQKATTSLWSDVDNGIWSSLSNWQYQSIYNYYSLYSNNLKNIFSTYTGTNKIVVDTAADSKKLMFNGYEYIGYMDIKTNTITLDIL